MDLPEGYHQRNFICISQTKKNTVCKEMPILAQLPPVKSLLDGSSINYMDTCCKFDRCSRELGIPDTGRCASENISQTPLGIS
jgi:hypothetical protein